MPSWNRCLPRLFGPIEGGFAGVVVVAVGLSLFYPSINSLKVTKLESLKVTPLLFPPTIVGGKII